MDQAQFAEAVGLSRRTVASFELGSGLAYETTTEKLRAGLHALGIELLYEDEVPIGLIFRPPGLPDVCVDDDTLPQG